MAEKESTKTVGFRIPADEGEVLDKLIAASGKSTSDYMRDLIRQHIAAPSAEPETAVVQAAEQSDVIEIPAPLEVSREVERLEDILQDMYDMVQILQVHDTTDRIDTNAAFTRIALEEFLRIKHPQSAQKVSNEFDRRK